MLRLCFVKQHSTYDLYTRTGPDLRTIVESSNVRSGPIGLWEAFNVDFRIVWENPEPECQRGKKDWAKYIDWKVWPDDAKAEKTDDVDWGQYDIVIALDIAIPERVVKKFPQVMWCYYIIEEGPRVSRKFPGSPYYGYNVFLNHRLAKTTLPKASHEKMRSVKRVSLDFPYFIQSSRSIRDMYPESANTKRENIILSHHSYATITPEEWKTLSGIAPIWDKGKNGVPIGQLLRETLASKYVIFHPGIASNMGSAVIEGAAAGCLVLAGRSKLWGFPELISEELDFKTFDDLIRLLRQLQNDPALFERKRHEQVELIESWCYTHPTQNLMLLCDAFKNSACRPETQKRSEWRSRKWGEIQLLARRSVKKAKSMEHSITRTLTAMVRILVRRT